MLTRPYLGELEQLVLLTVLRLAPQSYGMNIRREITARTERDVAIGAVYSALDRLERKGLVTSHNAPPVAKPGGRSRRCFAVTRAGLRALEHSLALIDDLRRGLTLGVAARKR